MVLLVDIDGVLKNGMEQLSGTSLFFNYIEKRPDLKVILLSNSTILTGEEVGLFFGEQLPNKVKILTALDVAINYSKTCESIKVYCLPNALKHFDDKNFSNQPKTLIVGDIGEKWNYETMNEIFTHVREGSELVAIQMNKYGIKNGSLKMDSGAFLNAIKYATDCEIKLLGKPGISFFKAGLEMSNYDGKEEKWMIGDDLIGDIEGGKNAGCTTFLPLTGKTRNKDLEANKIKPDYVINSIEDIIPFLE